MIKKIDIKIPKKVHFTHYFSLISILVMALLGFLVFSYDKIFQCGIAFAASLAYLSWGVVHHRLHKDLTWMVFLEYLAVSILGLIVVVSLILRS